MRDQLKVFACSGNPDLAKEICRFLSVKLGDSSVMKFTNDNTKVKIEENVREADVFVIQSSVPPVNDGIMELLIMIDALKYASAKRITAVLPYYPYVRSDKKDEPRISITARLVADLLKTAGTDRVLTMNLHSPQIAGFFEIPVDHLAATPILCRHFEKKDLNCHVLVAPDAGSAKRAGRYANRLHLPLAILDKRRSGDDETPAIENIIGDVEDRNVIIFDDEIATGGSICETVDALKRHGAKDIYVSAVHPVLCGSAMERISDLPIKELVVTNTIPVHDKAAQEPRITVLSVAPLFAKAISHIHSGESVSNLFS